jgi:flagellar FliL protein
VENEKEAGTKKPMLKWIVLAGVLIVLGAGGFTGWRMFFAQDADASVKQDQVAETSKKIEQEMSRLVYPLDSFVVNLMDKRSSGQRYLKTTIELEVDDEAARDMVQKNKAQLRDTILLLLTSQSFKEISSIEGKLDLKQGLLARINQTLGSSLVRRIYFTEFVVQ